MYNLKYSLKGNDWQQVETFNTLYQLTSSVKEMLQQGCIESVDQLEGVSVGNLGNSIPALITVLKQLRLCGCNVLKGQIDARIDYLESCK